MNFKGVLQNNFYLVKSRVVPRGVLEVTKPCNQWKTHPAGNMQGLNLPMAKCDAPYSV